jgi:hypothetical protein
MLMGKYIIAQSLGECLLVFGIVVISVFFILYSICMI